MIGAISHVVYAARLLTHLGEDVTHASYWNGVLFPDIRKLNVRRRHATHPQNISIKTLRGQNDFLTGTRVHAWIQDTHEQYDRNHIKLERIPDHPLVPYARSLLTDELLYDALSQWDVITRALRTITHDELYYVHERASIRAWHDVLQHYIAQKPSDASRIKFSRAIGVSNSTARDVNTIIETLRTIPEVQKAHQGFIQEIEQAIS